MKALIRFSAGAAIIWLGVTCTSQAQQLRPFEQQLFDQAVEAHNRQQYTDAIDLLNSLLETQPEVLEPWMLPASCYVALDDFAEAGHILNNALGVLPDDPLLLQCCAGTASTASTAGLG